MNRPRVEISTGAAFLAALIFYLARPEELLAVLLPVVSHELGHILAMAAQGQRIQGFRAAMDGFTLNYTGQTDTAGQVFTAAAGPLAGFLYAPAASALGNRLDCGWLCLSAGVSLLLSLFNLLPARPLDGGRMLEALAAAAWGEERAGRLLCCLSLSTAALLMIAGTVLFCYGQGGALLVAGFWLLYDGGKWFGLVKKGKIV